MPWVHMKHIFVKTPDIGKRESLDVHKEQEHCAPQILFLFEDRKINIRSFQGELTNSK